MHTRQLLQGSTIWDGQCLPLRWFNRRERVQLSRVTWTERGSGCCAALGRVSRATRIALRFAATRSSATSGQDALLRLAPLLAAPRPSPPPHRSIDAYVADVSRDLGGLDAYARVLLQAMVARLELQERGAGASTANVGAIVSGLPGVGKTLLAQSLCGVLGVHATFLHAADIFKTYVGQSEAQLVRTFERVLQRAPSVLVVDGIEAITSTRAGVETQNALELGVLGTFLACLDKVKSARARVFVLGTTSRLDAMDPAVSSNGRLDLVVRVEPPGQRERLEILRVLTRTWPVARESSESAERVLERVSEATGGFVGADVLSLCQKALQLALTSSSSSRTETSDSSDGDGSDAATHPLETRAADVVVQPAHFDAALASTYPSVLQTHHVAQRETQASARTSVECESESSKTDASAHSRAFPGVYGMESAVETLHVSLLEPLEDCSRFLAFGTVPPKGILLTGAPGSGKSHLARAVADAVRRRGLASFVSVNCTDLLTKVVGDTEKALRELFATARHAAPCVLYFDQIESLAPVRGFDTSTEQTFDRMLSMLLVEMDGFRTSPARAEGPSAVAADAHRAFLKQHVVILASTTRRELLDLSILRPGCVCVCVYACCASSAPEPDAYDTVACTCLQAL